MFPKLISRHDRRVLFVGIVAVVGLIGASRAFPRWRRWHQEQGALAVRLTTELASAQVLLASGSAIRDSLTARNSRFLSLAPRILTGETPPAAGAALAALVSGVASAASVRLGAIQVRPNTPRHSVWMQIAVSGDVTGDIRGVTRFLAALEAGSKLLAVRELAVTQLDPAGSPDRPETLRVEFVVEGIALDRSTRKP